MEPRQYLLRIGEIVGDDVSDGEVNLRYKWDNKAEGKALIIKFTRAQKELRLLKKQVSNHISQIRSEYISARTQVGKGIGSGIAGALFGRRRVGSFNSIQRDSLRTQQAEALAPYERVKGNIDSIIHLLDDAKSKIELSPEYQNEGPSEITATEVRVPPQLPPRAAEKPINQAQYWVFLGDSVKGPFSQDQLSALFDTGTIAPTTQCCVAGTEDWFPFSDLQI